MQGIAEMLWAGFGLCVSDNSQEQEGRGLLCLSTRTLGVQ